MSNSVFNARFTPTASSALSADEFQVVANIFDGTGAYSALDVALDDVVFLDTFNSITAPSTVSRYTVQSIITASISSVELVLKYADTGTPVDPGEITGNPGFVGRASAIQTLAYHAAPSLHTFPDYLTQYARNYDSFIKLEAALSGVGGDASVIQGLYSNGSGSTISALTLVRQNSAGNIFTIDPSVEAEVVSYLGVLVGQTLNNANGAVALAGLIKNITTSFVIGDILYLSKTGTLTTSVPEIGAGSFAAGDFVVKVGKISKNSVNGAQKDLKVEIELKGQL